MSFWTSSRRSFRGLANFWVRLWDGLGGDFCCVDDWIAKEKADAKTGTACRAPTIKIAMAVCLTKLGSFIVRAEDFLRHWRLYLKASWTWMRRSWRALPGRSR